MDIIPQKPSLFNKTSERFLGRFVVVALATITARYDFCLPT